MNNDLEPQDSGTENLEPIDNPKQVERLLRRLGFYDHKDLQEVDRRSLERRLAVDRATQGYARNERILESPEEQVKRLLADIEAARIDLTNSWLLVDEFFADSADLSELTEPALRIIRGAEENDLSNHRLQQAIAVVKAMRAGKAANSLSFLKDRGEFKAFPDLETKIDAALTPPPAVVVPTPAVAAPRP